MWLHEDHNFIEILIALAFENVLTITYVMLQLVPLPLKRMAGHRC
jgi:hypothetical protein